MNDRGSFYRYLAYDLAGPSMTLPSGARLGPYEIYSALGAAPEMTSSRFARHDDFDAPIRQPGEMRRVECEKRRDFRDQYAPGNDGVVDLAAEDPILYIGQSGVRARPDPRRSYDA